MTHPPEPDSAAMFGLFYSLLLSLENKGILKRDEFTADLEQTPTQAKAEKFIRPSALSDISRMKTWIENQ